MFPRQPGQFDPRYAHFARPHNENQQPTDNGNQLVPHAVHGHSYYNQLVPRAVHGQSYYNQSVQRYQNITQHIPGNIIQHGLPQYANTAYHQMAAHNLQVLMAAGLVHNRGFHQQITRPPTTAPVIPAVPMYQQTSHFPPVFLPQVGQMHPVMYQPHIRFPMAPSRTPTPRLDIPNNRFSVASVVPNQHIYPPMGSLPMTPDTPTTNRIRQGLPQYGNNSDHQIVAHNRPVPMAAGPIHNWGFQQQITRRPTSAPGMPAAYIDQQNSVSPPPLLPHVRQMHQEMYQPHIRFPMAPSRTPTPRLDIPNNQFSVATMVPNHQTYPPMSSLPMTPDTPTAMLSHPNGHLQSASMHPTRYMNHPNQGYFTPAPSPGLPTQQLIYHESQQPQSSCQQAQDSGHDLNPAAKEFQPSPSSVHTFVDDVTQRLSQLHLGDPVNASQHFQQVDSVSNLSNPPTIQERRMSRNISPGDYEYSSVSTSGIPPSGPQTPVSLHPGLSPGHGSALQQNIVKHNLMEYLENVGKAPEPRDDSHRLISESHHIEETVGQQTQSLESQSGQSSVLPACQEDEVTQKAEKVPSVLNDTCDGPKNSQNLDNPRDTTESLEYTTRRSSDREHYTADPLIGLLPQSTGEATQSTSRNAPHEIHSSKEGDGMVMHVTDAQHKSVASGTHDEAKIPESSSNAIDSTGPADSSTSYVLPISSALSNGSLDHWRQLMEILSLPRIDNGRLNKHEVIQKLLDILSTCDGAQRQCVFDTLLAMDREEAPQMPDMLMQHPGVLVILIDEIIVLTRQLTSSKSTPLNTVHRGTGVLGILQRMAAKNEVAQFLKNACIHSMIFPIVSNTHADWATDVEDYVLEALKVYQILVHHIPPHIYTEKHLFGAPSLLECLVNGDLAPKKGSDAEVHRVAEYIICKTLTTRESVQICCEDENLLSKVVTTLINMLFRSRDNIDCLVTPDNVVQCWLNLIEAGKVKDTLISDFPEFDGIVKEIMCSSAMRDQYSARNSLFVILKQLKEWRNTKATS